MFFQEARPENNLSNITSTQKTTVTNMTNRTDYQEMPKKRAETSSEANISEAYSLSLCELQQMERAMEQLRQDLKASESRFRNVIEKMPTASPSLTREDLSVLRTHQQKRCLTAKQRNF